MVSPVYEKLNRIDSVLKSKFENVKFIDSSELPKSNKGHEQYMFVVESINNPNYKIKMIFNGVDVLMMENNINWSYFEDTNNEGSNKINRKSNLEYLVNDISTIFEKKMFNESYLESIVVNESLEDTNEVVDKPLFENRGGTIYISEKALTDLFSEYGLVLEDLEMNPQFTASGSMGTRYLPSEADGYEITANISSKSMSGDIDPATFLKLESRINKFENVECNFSTYKYKVTINIDGNEAKLVD